MFRSCLELCTVLVLLSIPCIIRLTYSASSTRGIDTETSLLLYSSLQVPPTSSDITPTIRSNISAPEYVLVEKTGEIRLMITNTGMSQRVIIVKVESLPRYVEVVYPAQDLIFTMPPGATHTLNIIIKGVAEGEELLVITVLDSLTNHTLMEATRLQVTTLRTVYIHAYGVINLFTLEIVKKPIALYSVRLCNISASHARDNVYRVGIPRILKKCDLYYEYYLIEDSYEVSLAEDTIYLTTIDTESNHSILIIAIILFMPAIFFVSRRYVEDLIEALTIAIAASVALTTFALKWYLSFIVLGLGLAILIFDLVVILWRLGIFSRIY